MHDLTRQQSEEEIRGPYRDDGVADLKHVAPRVQVAEHGEFRSIPNLDSGGAGWSRFTAVQDEPLQTCGRHHGDLLGRHTERQRRRR